MTGPKNSSESSEDRIRCAVANAIESRYAFDGQSNRFIILIAGLPASGKTRFCNEMISSQSSISEYLLDCLRGAGYDSFSKVQLIHLEYDQVYTDAALALGVETYSSELWKEVRRLIDERLRSVHGTIGEGLSGEDEVLGTNRLLWVVLLDDNFYYRSMRKQLRPDGIIHVKESPEVCRARNAARRPPVPDGTFERAVTRFEEPTVSEGPLLILQDLPSKNVFLAIRNTEFWKFVIDRALPELAPVVSTGQSAESGGSNINCLSDVSQEKELLLRRVVHEAVGEVRTTKPPRDQARLLSRRVMAQVIAAKREAGKSSLDGEAAAENLRASISRIFALA